MNGDHDIWTMDLTLQLRNSIRDMTGHFPHVILNLLNSTKMDPNLEKAEATFSNVHAEQVYDEYYDFIHRCKAAFTVPGLLVDIHGHNHINVRTEFGYLLSADDFNQNRLDPQNSSIRALAVRNIEWDFTFDMLLRGKESLGGLVEDKYSYEADPSPHHPNPEEGIPYYNGLYTIEMEGSRDGGNVDAILLVAPEEEGKRPEYAQMLSNVLVKFMEKFYALDKQIEKINQQQAQFNKIKTDVSNPEKAPKSKMGSYAVAVIATMVGIVILLMVAFIIIKRRQSNNAIYTYEHLTNI